MFDPKSFWECHSRVETIQSDLRVNVIMEKFRDHPTISFIGIVATVENFDDEHQRAAVTYRTFSAVEPRTIPALKLRLEQAIAELEKAAAELNSPTGEQPNG